MTKKDKEVLRKYEAQLNMALRCDFVRMSASEWNEIADVYLSMFGIRLSKSENACSACRLKAIKRLAEEYQKAVSKTKQ